MGLIDVMSYVIPIISCLVFVGICVCFFRVFGGIFRSKYMARSAIPLNPEEAQKIIDSLQGDWDLTVQTWMGNGIDRMTVSGNMAVSKFGRGRHGRSQLHLRPAKLTDGTLILDNMGTEAVVFTPEEGYMETKMMGRKCEWKKVQGQTTQRGGVREASSSSPPTMVEELQKLNQLKNEGGLTEEEFSAAKLKMLNPGVEAPLRYVEKPPPYPGDLEAGQPSAPPMDKSTIID